MNRLLPHKRLPLYALFWSVGAIITFVSLMASPSDPKNAVFLGYSLERVLLGFGVLSMAVALLYLSLKLFRRPETSQRIWEVLFQQKSSSAGTLLVAVSIFLILWILLFLPSYRLDSLTSYLSRLFPILIWMMVTSGVTIMILIKTRKEIYGQDTKKEDWSILKIGMTVYLALLFIALIVVLTGFGIRNPEDYWYGAGVPILGLQILVSLIAGAIFLVGKPSIEKIGRTHLDHFLFISIWIFSGFFWAQVPLSPNYFMPDTAGNPIYPYSDGATFDVGAQYALIGQGVFNSVFFERSVYSILFVYLHSLFGQDFVNLMTIQAAIFAVLPALIYLIGKELHSRAMGISAGILLSLRGINAIVAARWIDTASPKMMLTDFPTAIGIAVFLLLFLKWIKRPSQTSYVIWAGAVFALTFMVRSNVLTLVPVTLLLMFLFNKMQWRQIVLAGFLILLGFLTVTLPWEVRNQSHGIPMYSMYYSRIIQILRSRYGLDSAYAPSTSMDMASNVDLPRVPVRQKVLAFKDDTLCASTLCGVSHHFLHNVVTSIVSLPASLVYDDLWNTVKADTPYWKKSWSEGKVGVIGGVLIAVNLGILSLGFGSIWSKNKNLSLLPVIIFLTYLLTNSLGLTSGGRYIAPVDWIVHLYFISGGMQLVIWFLRAVGVPTEETELNRNGEDNNFSIKDTIFKSIPTLLTIFIVGMLLPVSELFFKPRYQVLEPDQILSSLDKKGFLEQSGFSRDELLLFLSQPNAMIREGRALYPRYYPKGDGEQDRSTYYRYLDYQRLVFTLISPYNESAEGVVIAGYPPPVSMHAEDVVVLGCWNTTYYAPFIDAIVVFFTSEDGYVYTRSPGAPLQCPLPEPN